MRMLHRAVGLVVVEEYSHRVCPPLPLHPRRDRLPPLKGVMRGLVVDDGSKVPVLIGALKAVEIVTVATTTGGIAHSETLHLKHQDNPK